jgi:hypothetical protein
MFSSYRTQARHNMARSRLPITLPTNFHKMLWLALSEEARAAAVKTSNEGLQAQLLLQAARYTLLAERAAKTPEPGKHRT